MCKPNEVYNLHPITFKQFNHMKRIYFLLFIIPVFLISCDKEDDIQIKTTLPLTLSVEVREQSAVNQMSGQAKYSFTASKTYYLSDNQEVKDYLSNMNYIANKGHSMGVTGLADGDTINNIVISVKEGTGLMAFESVTSTNTGTSVPVDEYANFGDILLSEKQITVTVTGTTSKAPMDFDVHVALQIEVYADEL